MWRVRAANTPGRSSTATTTTWRSRVTATWEIASACLTASACGTRMCSSARSPEPMQVAAAMFTPASLIAAATCASAPGVFSISMTRSYAMRCAGASLLSESVSAPPDRYDHVIWIVMENHSYDQIIGSSDAPYINRLAGEHGLATNFYAEAHPSLPNYIAMSSGSTQGIDDDDDPDSHPLDVPSIFSVLPGGGSRSLLESMPSNCARADAGDYAVRHNPQAYYVNLGGDC